MYHRILVPTDGSGLSQKAVDSAIEQAASCGAELVVLHVLPVPAPFHFDGTLRSTAVHATRQETTRTAHGKLLVEQVEAAAARAGVKCQGVLAHADVVAEAILATAKEHECDLIVMASHGRQGIERVLFGSQAEDVLADGSLPVLVLR
jgi:nucleotide-binding universal stress UspA family protein